MSYMIAPEFRKNSRPASESESEAKMKCSLFDRCKGCPYPSHGLCDFCDESRFIDLYRSLCRHIYYQYPQLVGEYVALFRALFEVREDDNEQGEEQRTD